MHEQKPWLKFYGSVPHSIPYPEVGIYDAVMKTVREHPDDVAYDFMGSTATYREFGAQIDELADALSSLGLQKGDRITIAMPTSPPGVVAFYAANKLGAVSSMIHPLSTESEVEFYVTKSKSKIALTLDMFFDKFEPLVKRETCLETLIIAKIGDYLPSHLRLLFWLKQGRKNPKIEAAGKVKLLKNVLASDNPQAPAETVDPHDLAVILYSGGTTGTPKGVMLSNYALISEGLMVAYWAGLDRRFPRMLAVLPIFHGFGLGVCVNTLLMAGGTCIMVPRFEPSEVAKIIERKKPNYIVGPPTLFAALNKSEDFRKADLSCLKAAFSGADSLPKAVKEEFEANLRRQGCDIDLLEGYGLTEAVTAIMATPIGAHREGSIGVPFPDMSVKIVKPDTIEEAPVGEEGEICVAGPALMQGYLDNPEETAAVLREHEDGNVWLHTGDLGVMDEDGFFYFKLRLKRMIKTSGMNVYPVQVEEHLRRHPLVDEVCVIGVPDERAVERVKAFVKLKDPSKAGPEMEKELIEHCRRELIRWSCPREIEFRDEIPQTRIGKIAYKVLEEQERAKLQAKGEN